MGRPKNDMVGKQYGELFVLSFAEIRNKESFWNCRCSCGKDVVVSGTRMKSGKTKSCGHLKHPTKERNLLGMRFGRLTVISEGKERKYWKCECECGNQKEIYEYNLIHGKSLSCGCLQKEKVRESLMNDLAGKVFGRLTVLSIDSYDSGKRIKWICKCSCGNIVSIKGACLVNGSTTSCGCYKKELTSNLLSLKLENQRFGKMLVLKREGSYEGEDGVKYSQWLCQCDCGTRKIVRGVDLKYGKVTSCGCTISRGEEKVREILNDKKINYKTQYGFRDLKSEKGRQLKFDFALFDDKDDLICLVEYQGRQHDKSFSDYYGNFGKQQREITDLQKQEYCFAHNITLFQIWYNEDIEDSLDKIIKTTIKC